MATWSHALDGTNAANVTAGNSGFSSVAGNGTNGAALVVYDTSAGPATSGTWPHEGTSAAHFSAQVGTPGVAFLQQDFTNVTTHYVSAYFVAGGLPSANEVLIKFFDAGGVNTVLTVTYGGTGDSFPNTVKLQNQTGTLVSSRSGTITPGTIFRVDVSSVNGIISMDVYTAVNVDGTSGAFHHADNTGTGAQTNVNVGRVQIGMISSNLNTWATGLWVDRPAGSDSAYPAPVSSSTAPSNVSAPTITGSIAVGQTLTRTNGSWAGNPNPTLTTQWLQCDVTGGSPTVISGQTGATYVIQAGDIGHTIRVRVTATNINGTASADSAQTSVVAGSFIHDVNFEAGTVGQNLAANSTYAFNSVTNPVPPSFGDNATNQWFPGHGNISMICTTDTSGNPSMAGWTVSNAVRSGRMYVNTPTYPPANGILVQVLTPAPQNLSAFIRILTTGFLQISDAAFTGQKTSLVKVPTTGPWRLEWIITPGAGSGRIQARVWFSPESTGAPDIDLDTTANQTISLGLVRFGVNYSGTPPTTAYTAFIDDLVDDTANSFPGPSAVGSSAPVNTSLPLISGTAQVGNTLTTSNGTWSGVPSPTFTYQWVRDSNTNIAAATSSSYTLQSADLGHTVKVIVTASNGVGSPVSATSASTNTVTGASSFTHQADFESGTDGATVAVPQFGFSAVGVAGAEPRYDMLGGGGHPAHGTGSMLCHTDPTGTGVGLARSAVDWTATAVTRTGRAYVYLTDYPANNMILAGVYNAGAPVAFVRLMDDGSIQCADNAFSAGVARSSAISGQVVPLNTLARIEWRFTPGATTGRVEAQVFTGDSTTLLFPIVQTTATMVMTTWDTIRIGATFTGAGVGTIYGLWLDDLVDTTGSTFPGPVGGGSSPPPPPAVFTHQADMEGKTTGTNAVVSDFGWTGILGTTPPVYVTNVTSNPPAAHGTVRLRCNPGGASNQSEVEWPATVVQRTGRAYVYLSSADLINGTTLAGNMTIARLVNGGTNVAFVRIMTDRTIQLTDNAFTAPVFKSTPGTQVVPPDQWVRIEWRFTPSVAGVGGQIECQVFTTPDGISPSWPIMSTTAALQMDTWTAIRMGALFGTGINPTMPGYYMDDLVDTTGSTFPGPVNPIINTPPVNVTPPTVTGTFTKGQALTAGGDTWTGGTITGRTYQWYRIDNDGTQRQLVGATQSTYTLTQLDVGFRLRCDVAATNSSGTATPVPSTSVGPVNHPNRRLVGASIGAGFNPPTSPPPPPPPPGPPPPPPPGIPYTGPVIWGVTSNHEATRVADAAAAGGACNGLRVYHRHSNGITGAHNSLGPELNSDETASHNAGRMLSYHLRTDVGTGGTATAWASIANGAYDSSIFIPLFLGMMNLQFGDGRTGSRLPTNVIFTLDAEMDRFTQEFANANAGVTVHGTAQDFKNAFAHLVSLVRSTGPSNLVNHVNNSKLLFGYAPDFFAMQTRIDKTNINAGPGVGGVDRGTLTCPPDNIVDIFTPDIYNKASSWGYSQGVYAGTAVGGVPQWHSMADLFNLCRLWTQNSGHLIGKQIMVVEGDCQDYGLAGTNNAAWPTGQSADGGTRKSQWFQDGATYMTTHADAVGWMYWDVDLPIDTTSTANNGWKAASVIIKNSF